MIEWRGYGYRHSVDQPRQVDMVSRRSGRIASSDRDGVLYRHSIYVRILTGGRDLAEYEEGSKGLHFHGNLWFAQEAPAQLAFDVPLEIVR